MNRRALLLAGLLATGAIPIASAEEDGGARVVILANADDPESLQLARHYAAARSVPASNVIALPLPGAETMTWDDFATKLWGPLLETLVRARLVDAIPMDLTDVFGRRKYAPYGHRITALVVCRGVPLRVAHDPARFVETPPFTHRGEFRTNGGAVDSELSLLALPNYPINALVPNPLFEKARPGPAELGQVVRVSRLDGPTLRDALGLVDRALAAERTGLLGRAYVDLSDRDAVGNGWLQAAAAALAEHAFEPVVDPAPPTFPMTARFDAPALYFGWYAGSIEGPFLLPGFRFPPGAIALHIHSYSAQTLRSPTAGWTGPFVARGVTATVGNVDEPYLEFTHRPHLFLRALLRGATLAEAAYESLFALSWQAILVGDPLYRPFAVSLGEQLARRRTLPPLLAGYPVLRRAHQLDAAGREAEATELAVAAQREHPNPALALELARRLWQAGDKGAPTRELGFLGRMKGLPPDEWALAREAAQLLAASGAPSAALVTWRMLLAQPLPREIRRGWLPDVIAAARAADDMALARDFERELERLAPEPAPNGGRTPGSP